MCIPKLDKVTLRAGTRYVAVQPDGTLSGERQLDADTEVELVVLTPTFNVYGTDDGETIMVRPEHEVR